MAKKYLLSEEDYNRTLNAVSAWERSVKNTTRPPSGPTYTNEGRWAKITEHQDEKYSWVGCRFVDGVGFESDEKYGKGNHEEKAGYAVEARYRSTKVLQHAVVWLTPAYSQGVSYYIFDYNPGVRHARVITAPKTITEGMNTTHTVQMIKLNRSNWQWDEDQEIAVRNPWSTDITIDSTTMIIQLAFTEGEWLITGVDCENSEIVAVE